MAYTCGPSDGHSFKSGPIIASTHMDNYTINEGIFVAAITYLDGCPELDPAANHFGAYYSLTGNNRTMPHTRLGEISTSHTNREDYSDHSC